MIVDSSAIVAILLRETGWHDLVAKIAGATAPGVGAVTLAETGLVLTAKIGKPAPLVLSRFLQETRLAVVPFAEAHWRLAVDAYARFGKGRHPASGYWMVELPSLPGCISRGRTKEEAIANFKEAIGELEANRVPVPEERLENAIFDPVAGR